MPFPFLTFLPDIFDSTAAAWHNDNFGEEAAWCAYSVWSYLIHPQTPRIPKNFPSRSSSKVVTKETVDRQVSKAVRKGQMSFNSTHVQSTLLSLPGQIKAWMWSPGKTIKSWAEVGSVPKCKACYFRVENPVCPSVSLHILVVSYGKLSFSSHMLQMCVFLLITSEPIVELQSNLTETAITKIQRSLRFRKADEWMAE